MIPGDPNVQRVELVAAALGELREQLVLVGGCAVSLLIDSATASPPRVTYDVDLIAEVAALRDYHVLGKALAQRRFARDRSPDAPICRWTLGAVKVDLMPTSEAVLGFSNPWYKEAMRSATRCTLPSGAGSPALHEACSALVGQGRMIAMSEGDLDVLLEKAGVEDVFPISGTAVEAALEDAAFGGIEGVRRLARRTSTRTLSKEELKQARNRAEEIGDIGEQFVHDHLFGLWRSGDIQAFVWLSASSATAPHDFDITTGEKKLLIDVKATNGSFRNRIHISVAELLEMAESEHDYLIYRIYEIDGRRARLRISSSMRQFAESVLEGLRHLPQGVLADSTSVSPDILEFGRPLDISIIEDEE